MNKITTNEALLLLAKRTKQDLIDLESRCEAAMAFAGVLAMRSGMSAEEVSDTLNRFSAHAYQKKLEEVERMNPGLAAEMDLRPELPGRDFPLPPE